MPSIDFSLVKRLLAYGTPLSVVAALLLLAFLLSACGTSGGSEPHRDIKLTCSDREPCSTSVTVFP